MVRDNLYNYAHVSRAPFMQLNLPLLNDVLKQLEILRKENGELKQEVLRLKNLLDGRTDAATSANTSISYGESNAIALEVGEPSSILGDGYPKIALDYPDSSELDDTSLFMSLFKGRSDVYAERWESGDNSGYSPARRHDWSSHIFDARKRRKVCKKTESCKLLPLTQSTVHEHLYGSKVIGVYPLLPDDTCHFLAIDFDEDSWMQDSAAFLDACGALSVPAYRERSRSGNGAHVWIFFYQAMSAANARKLGSILLTLCKEEHYQLSFSSYDRMFPNQDTMPSGKFGNLIALPLQNEAVTLGNSSFVDRENNVIGDQWAFLRTIQRITPIEVEQIIRQAAKTNTIIPVLRSAFDENATDDPWTVPPSGRKEDELLVGPFPEAAKIISSNMLYVDKLGFSSRALNRLLNMAAFQNPVFHKQQAMRLPTFGIPRIISCGEDLPKHIALPRGCMDNLVTLFIRSGVRFELQDETFDGKNIDVSFNGQLRPQQEHASIQISEHDIGILSATTAFGKTVVAAHAIAERAVNTLVLVHRVQILQQWIERLSSFLDVPPNSIGQLGGGKDKRTGIIDIATIQSVQKDGVVKDLVADYGHVIVDECHHIAAFSFEQVLKQVKAKYVLGLTATPIRQDGHHPIIIMQCGPVRFRVKATEDTASGIKEHLVIPRHTSFSAGLTPDDVPIQELISLLAAHEERNDLLFDDILQALEQKRSPLVITERTEHLECLAQRLQGFVKNILVFKGGLGKKQLTALVAKLKSIPPDEERLILATGRYIGEGFDDARLDTLFLALPFSWKGTVEQYAGRLHRNYEGKSIVRIYDYVDANVPRLIKMYSRRLKAYKTIGYRVDA